MNAACLGGSVVISLDQWCLVDVVRVGGLLCCVGLVPVPCLCYHTRLISIWQLDESCPCHYRRGLVALLISFGGCTVLIECVNAAVADNGGVLGLVC